MEFSQLMAARYSVRAYRKDKVEEEKLNFVLEAARLAPTACNLQPFRITVIQTAGRERDLLSIYPRDWFVQAPLVICACGVTQQGWVRRADEKNYTDVDVAIVVDHLTLAAANRGLGTCWIAAFDPAATRRLLALPPGVEPVALTPLGYPADQPRPKDRKPLAELVRYDHW
jgi:nitroreductase